MSVVRFVVIGWLVMMAAAVGCGDEVVVEGAEVPCGPKSCAPSEYCCDAKCGICRAQGVVCSQRCE